MLLLALHDTPQPGGDLRGGKMPEAEPLVIGRVPWNIPERRQGQSLKSLFRRPPVHVPDQGCTDTAAAVVRMHGDLLDVGPTAVHLDQDVADGVALRPRCHPSSPARHVALQLFSCGRWVISDGVHSYAAEEFPGSTLNLLEAP